MLEAKEIELIERIQASDNPLSISDKDLDSFVDSIKKARGDHEKQLRREIRRNIATHHDWKFAMDGGFMPKQGQPGYPSKEWQHINNGMFGAAYARFERLALYLHLEKGMSLDEIESLSVSPLSAKDS